MEINHSYNYGERILRVVLSGSLFVPLVPEQCLANAGFNNYLFNKGVRCLGLFIFLTSESSLVLLFLKKITPIIPPAVDI